MRAPLPHDSPPIALEHLDDVTDFHTAMTEAIVPRYRYDHEPHPRCSQTTVVDRAPVRSEPIRPTVDAAVHRALSRLGATGSSVACADDRKHSVSRRPPLPLRKTRYRSGPPAP